MIACIDVGYRRSPAIAAAVTIADWEDDSPLATYAVRLNKVADYVPGEFYKRELPCIQAVLAKLRTTPDVIVIDGFVWLDENGKKGLGARLHDLLNGTTPVIGVAKTFYATATGSAQVYRGGSDRPLYVTAAGLELHAAMDAVLRMHGPHRIPTMLNLVDRLSKGSATPNTK